MRFPTGEERKRNSAHDISIDELAADIPDFFDVEEEVLKNELADEISAFIRELSPESRYLFMQRYWYDESLEVIAKAIKRNKHYVSVRLSRIRKSLKNYLSDKGVCI